MEGIYTEYITEKAIVRIHPGKLTDEERKVVFENAAKQFFQSVCKQKSKEAAKAAPNEADSSDGVRNGNADRGLL